jgi:hypothetical protein
MNDSLELVGYLTIIGPLILLVIGIIWIASRKNKKK